MEAPVAAAADRAPPGGRPLAWLPSLPGLCRGSPMERWLPLVAVAT